MYNIGLIGYSSPSRLKVKQQLEKIDDFTVNTYSRAQDAITAFYQKPNMSLIFVIEDFREKHFHILKTLKWHLGNTPFVVVTNSITPKMRLKIANADLPCAAVLDRRHEITDLNKVMSKLSLGEMASHRKYPRYRANQPTKVHSKGKGSFEGVIQNLSFGGALVKIPDIRIVPGETVFVNVQPKTESIYLLPARVVWVSKKDDTMGIEFEKPQTQKTKVAH